MEQPQARIVGNWILGSQLGSGSFAVVWRATERTTGRPAAVKEISLNKLNSKLRSSLESEVSILKKISHPNIVELYEVIQDHHKLYLVMEYCAGGDLAQLLRKQGRVSESTARHLMTQLAAGLQVMWFHHLVHRDIKPQNLLLSESSFSQDDHKSTTAAVVLKIADFGFARCLQPQGLAETLCGSPLYMAPEILQLQRYDAKADLWSVGAVLFELIAGKPPFTGPNQYALLKSIQRSEARLPDDIIDDISPSCKQLLHSLLRRNPVERISFEEFFQNPFLVAARGTEMRASRSADNIPQHIVGFNDGTTSRTSTAATARPYSTAVKGGAHLPAGQLTSQLKPNKSMDFDLPFAQPLYAATSRKPASLTPVFAVGTPAQPRPSPTAPPASSSGGDIEESYVLVDAAVSSMDTAVSSRQNNAVYRTTNKPVVHRVVDNDDDTALDDDGGNSPDDDGLLPEPFLLRDATTAQELQGNTSSTTADNDAVLLPWQASGHRQFLRCVAGIITALANESFNPNTILLSDKASSTIHTSRALSLYLAALQLYELAIDDTSSASEESMDDTRSSIGSINTMDEIKGEASNTLKLAQAAAEALNDDTNEELLPHPWEACRASALRWAQDAAADELLGLYSRSEDLYGKSAAVLHFLAAEAPALKLWPPAALAAGDEVRLRQCAAAAAARHAVCAALARLQDV